MKVTQDSFVTMHFKIRLKDGSIAEDTRQYNQAFSFQMSDQIFSDKFEQALYGLSEGEHKKIMLLPEDAFGDVHPALIYQVPKYKFTDDIELDLGVLIAFSQPDGSELPGLITKIEENEVTVDFNHPLAGKVVLFEVDILKVENAND
ncbi:FKBP-type peptidyl-prolyl cis-trans isomerase [Thiotrichales bacterium 19S11-10]|nr:FKBP-type peptidyl-prolyl cis-trans isomerase [Thiotrichales bacterium 19S11-10]MCF6807929.1 FKBP-type peptidyl-prolyl cis-trans isomerase [Thiotrichales bacterium 19S9-11]MCF6811944.1 FKBP-type peptidyl-prolyl cis-trans isomerase [Thiotrichales bacterium 19S9-12]